MTTNYKIPEKLLIRLRKVLHKHPELSEHEEATAKRIAGFLKSYKPNQIIENLGGHGVAAVFQYYGNEPTILIRCELDALPIKETNDFEYRSVERNISHKCGHDGHMAIVAGLAAVLGKNRPKKGRVVLLFQPAEENGAGAVQVLKDKKFKKITPDYVFALHNLPGYPLHEVVTRAGNFTATAKSMIIRLEGKTSHASEPEKGINPAMAIAEILQQTHKLSNPESRFNYTLVTPIQIEMGEEAYGISAGEGVVKLTLRTLNSPEMERLSETAEKLVREIASRHGLKVSIEWTQFFASNHNNEEMVKVVEQAAKANGLKIKRKKEPFYWGEDFGLFTEKYKGAMFGIGAGKKMPALHNPDYDFPDEIIPTGVKMFKSIIDQLLN